MNVCTRKMLNAMNGHAYGPLLTRHDIRLRLEKKKSCSKRERPFACGKVTYSTTDVVSLSEAPMSFARSLQSRQRVCDRSSRTYSVYGDGGHRIKAGESRRTGSQPDPESFLLG